MIAIPWGCGSISIYLFIYLKKKKVFLSSWGAKLLMEVCGSIQTVSYLPVELSFAY